MFTVRWWDHKLLDELEPLASTGGIILDWHACDVFPERWADLVVVLRCNHTQLWERLEKRCVTKVLVLNAGIFNHDAS
jgi:broad-specificity NMP kinase